MSMGYQVGVTALQMVTAVSSVANGGELIQPRVVRALVRGGERYDVKPTVLGRTITQETAATLTGTRAAPASATPSRSGSPTALGTPLPTLPLWLASDRAIPLELEASYEATCEVLRIQ